MSDALPVDSVAVQFTVVVPRPNVLPEVASQLTVGVLTLSLAVAAKVTTAPAELIASAVMLSGNDNVGGVVS